jgi:heme-degrading monooxygenase HmoA
MWQARGMVLEIAVFTTKPGHADQFAAAYGEARELILASPGCLSARMTRGIEDPDRFTLIVEWETVEAHLEGFRGSERFPRWRELIGPHFDAADVRHTADL